MKQRNKVFAGLSVAVAIAAIGAGATVSANAMADDGNQVPTDQLTMLNVSTDGTAVQCTFDSADAAAIIAASPVPVPTPSDATKTDGGVNVVAVSGSGTIESGSIVSGSVPPGVQRVHIAGSVVSSGSGTVLGKIDAPADGSLPVLVSTDSARSGTPAECAAMKADALNGAKP